jgi:transcriptional regulator with XRE-family HTH domain
MFIEKLKSLMKERKVTNKQLCSDIGIGINQIKYWEKNGNTPSGDVLKKIAAYFGITVSELLEEKKPAENGGRAEEFMRLYEALSPELQEAFLLQLRGLSNKK